MPLILIILLHHKNLTNNAFAKHNGCGTAVENISLPLFGNIVLHWERKIPSSWFYSKERANLREQSLLSEEHPLMSVRPWENVSGNHLKLCLFVSIASSRSLGSCCVFREGGLLGITSSSSWPRGLLSCFHEWRENFKFSSLFLRLSQAIRISPDIFFSRWLK